jgi:hypothetical protein
MVGWRKSTYSDGNGGECVELASDAETILVRDTADRNGVTLSVTARAWRDLLSSLRLCAQKRPGRLTVGDPLQVRELISG